MAGAFFVTENTCFFLLVGYKNFKINSKGVDKGYIKE